MKTVSLNPIAPNFTQVTVGSLELYFSYKTCIAFNAGGRNVVRRNDWGPTTGKHLNYIDGGNKETRIEGEAFERMLTEALNEAPALA